MSALKGQEGERFIAKPDENIKIVLIYGPDNGLVRERGKALLKKWGAKADDPFSLVTLDEAVLKDDPARLLDEAQSISMFGGAKSIHLRLENGTLSEAMKLLLQHDKLENKILIEAGDLKPTHALRALAEKSPRLVAIACYADNAQDLAKLIESEVAHAQKIMSREAKELLLSLLGGDRALSRGEIQKLLLYTHDKKEITLQDVLDSVSDSAQTLMDELIDAAFLGKTSEALKLYDKAVQSEFSPVMIMIFLLRHTSALLKARLKIENGLSLMQAVENFEPRLHYKRKTTVEMVLKATTAQRLMVELEKQQLVSSEMRLKPALTLMLLSRNLMGLAMRARRR
jgi:DNA polymerase III subunit delta